jgi:hypothetical protein
MSCCDNSGLIFPTGCSTRKEGISLRDWFAGMAMQGILASYYPYNRGSPLIGRESYAIADAMLDSRKKGTTQ